MRVEEPTRGAGASSRATPRRPLHRRFLPTGGAESGGPAGALARLYVGEPEACRRSLRQFLPIAAHLALLVAVFHVYKVEGRAFLILADVALAALPIHYLLPFRLKKPFFLAASIVGLGLVFDAKVVGAVALMAAAFIAACYLPVRWAARAVIVAAMAGGLALGRGYLTSLPVLDLALPVLGTMMMFRMIIFLYELKHAKRREPVMDAVGYFFLLPNWAFPHFPVVDYRTFLRSHFAGEVHETQRRGLAMILRGTVQLLLYRLVYHQYLIPMDEVHDPASLGRFLACNYLLYLRVSGQFHVACGMLHLFGYRLPDTHNHWLLATGFTDYWRRINIYWKDFMVRVVFNPVVFRLKKRPQWQSLTIATAAVFLATWALHGYQSFWLRGSWSFSVPDALFWGVLGALVMVNVQLDARRSRARTIRPKAGEFSAGALAVRGLKVAGTLTTLMVLWSLWYSPSVGAWVEMWRRGLGG